MDHTNLLRDSRFAVFIDNDKYSFQKLGGISTEYAKEVYNEGGVEEPHILKGVHEEMRTLKLEHGVQTGSMGKQIDDTLKPGKYLKNIQILMLGKNNKPVKEYFIEAAVVTKVELAQFDAGNENVLIESFELEYYKMTQKFV